MRTGERARILLLAAAVCLSGCTQKMALQQRYAGDRIRVAPEGTLAADEEPEAPRPARITRKLLERGRDRFEIACSPCHGLAGYGDGMLPQRGFLPPPSYHLERLRRAPDDHFFDVITHGYGAMESYADHLAPADRWAVIAYIRALQLSQDPRPEALSAGERARLEKADAP